MKSYEAKETKETKSLSQKEIEDYIINDYEKICHRDPQQLRHLLPAEEIWRFFVEGVLQNYAYIDYFSDVRKNCQSSFSFNDKLNTVEEELKKSSPVAYKKLIEMGAKENSDLTLRELCILNDSWPGFEKREPGYLRALYEAFDLIFDFSKELSMEFIQHLHFTATQDVSGALHYAKDDEEQKNRGKIRNDNNSFGICSLTTTEGGLVELFNKMLNQKNISFIVSIKGLETANFTINKETINRIIDIDDTSPHEEKIKALAKVYHETIIAKHCPTRLHSCVKTNREEVYLETIKEEFAHLIHEYHEKMVIAKDDVDRLRCIITFIRDCEQLHPFFDANCRTFCMLLLNHLLMKNGFPPAIQKDPNNFDGHSVEELMREVMQGMKNTLKLVSGKRDLFDMTTSITRKHVKEELGKYFDNICNKEEENRKKMQVAFLPPGKDYLSSAGKKFRFFAPIALGVGAAAVGASILIKAVK